MARNSSWKRPAARIRSAAGSSTGAPHLAADAVESFTESFGRRVGRPRMNVLSPGTVDTESLRNALGMAQGADAVPVAVQKMGEGNPTGRIADPREMGKAAAFLSSDASSFITGVELFADGGMAQV
ncbi:SDR family oxidoreductase [Streptomyces sp. NPDC056938]|uniref:SDR family oxidoreductase n=1 Tax=unclassified Streptomyces TaxID=2593676 RepID=UPI00362F8BD8